LKYNEAIQSINNSQYFPVYFLQGENTHYIDEITKLLIDKVLDESERDFNQTIFYGKETTVDQIIDAARRYPVMSSYQLIIVKEAQHLNRVFDKFEGYFKDPVPTTILVFNFKNKKLDKRKAVGKLLSQRKFIIDLDAIKDYQIPEWVLSCAKKHQLKMDQKASILISEFLGNDLSSIDSTLQKLKLLISSNQIVDVDIVQQHVGFSKDFNLFELQNAIAAKNIQKANFIAKHFAHNPKNYPLVLTLGNLYSFFTKLMKYHFYVNQLSNTQLAAKVGVNPYFLKQYEQASRNYSKGKLAKIFGYLRDYDLMSKGVGNSSVKDDEILKEMIFKIMH
tara:strand:- start:1148 stop:2152 length:1005 start_codon:yes stop_codon:yes gene_type:complete